MLVYNDPEYGFFGDLMELTTAEAYKICVKDGAHFDMFLYDGGIIQAVISTLCLAGRG